MFHDPALVFACDLPIGWCLDAESSLFRVVFRPWDRANERVILTVLPTAAAAPAADEEWAAAAQARLGIGGPTKAMPLGAGVAFTAPLTTADGQRYQRVAIRGPTLDLVADHVRGAEDGFGVAPVLVRLVAGVRVPARLPVSDVGGAVSPGEARAEAETLDAAGKGPDIVAPALQRAQRAAEEHWLRSLIHPNFPRVDLQGFQTLLWARLCFGHSPSDLLSLLRAHSMLLRAVPGQPPTGPYLPTDELLRPSLSAACKELFGVVAGVLRRRPDLQSLARQPDDEFGSDYSLQALLGFLLTEQVRETFRRGEWVRPEAAYEAVLARLCSLGMVAPDRLAAGQAGALVKDLWALGRAVIAYLDALKADDDRDGILESADLLAAVGRRLTEAAGEAPETGWYRPQGTVYEATAKESVISVLTRAADESSLKRALGLAEEAHRLLDGAPESHVDRSNLCQGEALAALQLGDLDRADRVIRRGADAAAHLTEEHPKKLFDHFHRIAEVIRPGPRAVRSYPELERARAEAEEGVEAALSQLCAGLAKDLAYDPTGPHAIERLVMAAQILPPDASDKVGAAVESLLDLKRLLVGRGRELRIGADDSLLARRVAAGAVARLVAAGQLSAAITAADRGRARSLLVDLDLPPGITAHLKEAVSGGPNPGIPLLVEEALRERWPLPHRPLPPWGGPMGLRAISWLRRLADQLRDWVRGLTVPLGAGPYTQDELIAAVRAQGQPVLVLHPLNGRVALFLVTPDGEVHHRWSPGTAEEVLAHAEQLRLRLGVWVSARQRGGRDLVAVDEDTRVSYREAAAETYRCLIAPLRGWLSGFTHLTIVPYRELGAVPYALLEDETGAPLLNHFAVSIAPSIATLAVLKSRRRGPGGRPAAYVLGDPATPRAERLHFAAQEAECVRRQIATAHPVVPIHHRSGHEATPADYRAHAQGARLVHLACHAGVGPTASAAALHLAPDLNGQGALDAAEVARTPLSNALVFLAACRSGAGRAAAEGTVGLAREFLLAGARAVVASFWMVPDEATSALVEHFYTAFLGGGNDVAASLKLAMCATRKELAGSSGGGEGAMSHVAAWGPFFVLGDGTLRDEL
jgi:CHAT domain-containing protein